MEISSVIQGDFPAADVKVCAVDAECQRQNAGDEDMVPYISAVEED